jgi:hypothetical protein
MRACFLILNFLTCLLSFSWKRRLGVIYRATRQHAMNLAKFVSLYKAFLLIQKKANGGKERSSDTFVAGLLGGYLVFGDRTAVNEQVRLNSRTSSNFICLRAFHVDRALRSITCCSLFHSKVHLSVLHTICFSAKQPVRQTSPAKLSLFLALCGLVMGSCNVAVQE